MFHNNNKFTLEGNATIHVGGDQYNNCRLHIPVKKGKRRDMHKEYSQFQEIIRGNIRILRTLLDSKPSLDHESRFKVVRRTIFTADICPIVDTKSAKATVITYRGRNARYAWKKDFHTFAHLQGPNSFQLFGINRSEIPSLIFHDELVPLAHFYDKDSFWMKVYISYLAESLDCKEWENLWIDTTLGSFISGPTGPWIFHSVAYSNEPTLGQVVPATLDMLNRDTSFRYFSNQGPSMDKVVIRQATLTRRNEYMDTLFPQTMNDIPYDRISYSQRPYLESLWCRIPHNIPADTMDLGGWVWVVDQLYSRGSLLENGLTRFDYLQVAQSSMGLILEGISVDYGWNGFEQAIMAQLPRLVNGLESTDKIVMVRPPVLRLCGSGDDRYDGLAELFDLCDTAKNVKPIYLFIYSAPTTISGLMAWKTGRTHFWSFDETGRSEIADDERKEMGLPELAADIWSRQFDDSSILSWAKVACDSIRDWQTARGFDPTTADFARHLGYPVFEIIEAGNEEGRRSEGEAAVEDKSGLSWLWTAFPGSDISACAC